MQMLPILAGAIATDAHPLRHPLAFEQLESTLLNLLLHGHPNSARNGTRHLPVAIAPFYVRRVEDYIRAHLDEPLTIERLAELAGVSPSTLFAGFRHRHGTTPMGFVRQLRLQHVREELLADASPARVGDGRRAEWGFAHPGGSRSSTSGRSASSRRRRSGCGAARLAAHAAARSPIRYGSGTPRRHVPAEPPFDERAARRGAMIAGSRAS